MLGSTAEESARPLGLAVFNRYYVLASGGTWQLSASRSVTTSVYTFMTLRCRFQTQSLGRHPR